FDPQHTIALTSPVPSPLRRVILREQQLPSGLPFSQDLASWASSFRELVSISLLLKRRNISLFVHFAMTLVISPQLCYSRLVHGAMMTGRSSTG
ncbi:MAG TPA: hypothetical protein VH164_05010, partial [Ktedonobacteraceae bacterium]|nr:hypothetical protein [Ktedonobacteraceae bacterium]